MANLVDTIIFEKKLKKKHLAVFSPLDVRRVLGVSPIAAKFLLHRYAKKNFVVRVKRGLYVFSDAAGIPAPYIANRLYEPSYVSAEFALSYHGVIPETVYTITSVTTKNPRRFKALGKLFSYQRIKKEAFTGYSSVHDGEFRFFIADPEKAFVDLIYLRTVRNESYPDRFDRKKLNAANVARYAKLFRHQGLDAAVQRLLP